MSESEGESEKIRPLHRYREGSSTYSREGVKSHEMSLATLTILQTLSNDGRFGGLVEAIHRTGLHSALQGTGPITFLAPSSALPSGMSDTRAFLEQHIVEGKQLTADLRTTKRVRTRAGSFLPVEWSREQVVIGGSKITHADIACTNGVIQVVDHAVEVEVAPA